MGRTTFYFVFSIVFSSFRSLEVFVIWVAKFLSGHPRTKNAKKQENFARKPPYFRLHLASDARWYSHRYLFPPVYGCPPGLPGTVGHRYLTENYVLSHRYLYIAEWNSKARSFYQTLLLEFYAKVRQRRTAFAPPPAAHETNDVDQ